MRIGLYVCVGMSLLGLSSCLAPGSNKLSQEKSSDGNAEGVPADELLGKTLETRSPNYGAFVANVLGVGGKAAAYEGAEVEALVASADQGFDGALAAGELDLALLQANFAYLKPYQGMLWRLSEILAKLGNTQLHNLAIGSIKSVASGFTMLPDANSLDSDASVPHFRAMFNFISAPRVDTNARPLALGSEFKKFVNETDIVNFSCPVARDLAQCDVTKDPSLFCHTQKLRERLDKVVAAVRQGGTNYLISDKKLQYGKDSYPDGFKRYMALTQDSLDLSLAAVDVTLQGLATACAYNVVGTLPLVNRLTAAYISGTLPWQDGHYNGVPARDRVALIRKNTDNENFGTLRGEQGAKLMQFAYDRLISALKLVNSAYGIAKSRPSGTEYMPHEGLFAGYPAIDSNMEAAKGLVETGELNVDNVVTGRSFKVLVKDFYTVNPPKNLKVFLPTDFHGGDKEQPYFFVHRDVAASKYRNYYDGMPNKWATAEFTRYIRLDPADAAKVDVPYIVRSLTGSFGGALAMGPMVAAVSF